MDNIEKIVINALKRHTQTVITKYNIPTEAVVEHDYGHVAKSIAKQLNARLGKANRESDKEDKEVV